MEVEESKRANKERIRADRIETDIAEDARVNFYHSLLARYTRHGPRLRVSCSNSPLDLCYLVFLQCFFKNDSTPLHQGATSFFGTNQSLEMSFHREECSWQLT